MDNQLIHIQRPGHADIDLPVHTPVRNALAALEDSDNGLPYLGALVNNDVCSLDFPLAMNCEIIPITFQDRHGSRVYRRTLSFLLSKAVTQCFPDAKFAIEHSLGDAYYCSFQINGNLGIRKAELEKIEKCLSGIVQKDLPIERRAVSYAEAEERLHVQGLTDKLNLLQYRNPPMITVYECEEFTDAGLGILASKTGDVACFKILEYKPGFVIQFPRWHHKNKILYMPEFERQPHLFQVFQNHKKWGESLG